MLDTLTQFGFGGGAGFVLGYALKKIFKVFLVLLGLYFLSLLYLARVGYIDVNYDKLSDFGNFLTAVDGFQMFINLPIAGFVVGFLLGFKAG